MAFCILYTLDKALNVQQCHLLLTGMQQTQRCCCGWNRSNTEGHVCITAGGPEALLEDLNGLMTVLEEALKITVAADQNTDQKGTSWTVRVQSVKAILVLITIDTQVDIT